MKPSEAENFAWRKIFSRRAGAAICLAAVALSACAKRNEQTSATGEAASLAATPAARLFYRYEPDVPPPDIKPDTQREATDPRIVADFESSRPNEQPDQTIKSPDGRYILTVYHRQGDAAGDFRLDLYSAEAKLLRHITPDNLAVRFQEMIRWSPDSTTIAFVGALREVVAEQAPTPPDIQPAPSPSVSPVASEIPPVGTSSPPTQPQSAANLPQPAPIMAFRTEQLYFHEVTGGELRPVTRNEGFIYYYFAWAPDSSAVVAMALHSREWEELLRRADSAGMEMTPLGRPRIIELNGRERRLDDGLTAVRPVWSPDSRKVAIAFDTQIRIYDAVGENPTQAAIPLRNELLLSSKAYDDAQAAKLAAANSNAQPTAEQPSPTPPAAQLPDPQSLVSFNPIVQVAWTAPDTIYFETAYVRQMKNAADSVISFARWHRIILLPAPAADGR